MYLTIPEEILRKKDLNLNEKVVLALINSYSQDQQGVFYGSLSYIQDLLSLTRPTVVKILKRLAADNLVTKKELFIDGQKRVSYRVVKKFNQGQEKNLTRGSKEILPNNINNTKVDTPKEKISKKERARAFGLRLEEYVSTYGREMLKDFFNYWTESNEGPRAKLRFETQKIFDLERRLETWNRRNQARKITVKGGETPAGLTAEIVRRVNTGI